MTTRTANRMMRAAALGLAALLLAGCFNLLQPNDTAPTGETGNVRVSIPHYAPWLGQPLNLDSSFGFASRALGTAAATAAPRAYLIADQVVLTVFDASDVEVYSETFTVDEVYSPEEGDGTVDLSITLDAATGYTMRADIYNLDESITDPMVSGMSSSFDVTDGGVSDVAITCVPFNPTELVMDTQETFTQVTTIMDGGTGEITSLGGETWAGVTAPANGALWFDVDLPDEVLGLALRAYDDTGVYLSDVWFRVDPPDGSGTLLGGDGSISVSGLTPDETLYMVFALIGDGSSQSFTLTASSPFTITGTITVPGITDPTILPEYSGQFLAPAFNSSMNDWIAEGSLGGPEVSGSDLIYTYTIPYDGNETAVLGAGFVNSATFPQPGDWVGAWDGDTGTPMDFVAGTGIDPYHFSGNVTGIDITLVHIAETPIPASAFPDDMLRAAMEEIIGKTFTGDASGITDGDLLALGTIDLRNRGEAYTDLTGLELCDNVGLINFDGNDLSGCDLSTGSGGLAYEALAGMNSLGNLQFPGCSLDHLDFVTGASGLSYLNIAGNTGLSYAEQLVIDPAALPNLVHIWYNGNGNAGDPIDDTEWANLVAKIGGFGQLYSLGVTDFDLTPTQFDTLYTNVLSSDPAVFTELDFSRCSLDDSSVSSLANLTALEYLNLSSNATVTDVSALAVANLSSLQSINLADTSVTDLSPLQTLHGLGAFATHSHWGYDVDVRYLDLDLWPGTANRVVVDYLINEGVTVLYEDGNTLTEPTGSGSLEIDIY